MNTQYTSHQWRIWIQRDGNQRLCLLPSLFTCLPTSCFSSSLDALDADSEGDGPPEQSRPCYPPASQSPSGTGIPSGDELDSFETHTEPDFNIARTESLSLSSNLQSKVLLLVLMWFMLSGENVSAEYIHLWKTKVLFTCINFFVLLGTHVLTDRVCLFNLSYSNLYIPFTRADLFSLIHHQYV